MITLVNFISLGIAIFLAFRLRKASRRRRNLPPGPPADPIIGHLRLLAVERQEEVFHKLVQEYGDVVHLNVMGKDIIVLGREETAKELLEKRGAIYSNRPFHYFYFEVGWEAILTFLPYGGQRFLQQRKIIQQLFTSQKIVDYRDIQEREAKNLLRNLLLKPEDFREHLLLMTLAIIVDLTYGHRITSADDEFMKIAHDITLMMHQAERATILDLFPLLRILPERIQSLFTGSIEDTKRIIQQGIDWPMECVRQQMAEGRAVPSVATQLIEAFDDPEQDLGIDYRDVKATANVILAAGTETAWGTLVLFVAMMVLHPEAQKKAQEEIDRVVGRDRLPEFADRDSLPYVTAVMQETLRWHPSLPAGVAHRVDADDEYRGMFIPKGATIIPNVLSMSLDQKVYKDPQLFRPERFLPAPEGDNEPFSTNIPFGFGRRICPGQYLADATVWLAIAQTLAVFNISKEIDSHGKEIDLKLEFQSTGGLVSHPKPFRCRILPRTDNSASLAPSI